MTNINARIDLANQIFKKLDLADGKEDGKIEASIWNKFVQENGTKGREIKNCINKDRAIKSISTYLQRVAKNTGSTVENIAQTWLGGNKEDISQTRKIGKELSVEYPTNLHTHNGISDSSYQNEELQNEFLKRFEESSQLLMDIANNKYRFTISRDNSEGLDTTTIQLADGRKIVIDRFDDEVENNKNIISIYDKNNNGLFCFGTCWAGEAHCHFDRNGNSQNVSGKMDLTSINKIVERILGRKEIYGDFDGIQTILNNDEHVTKANETLAETANMSQKPEVKEVEDTDFYKISDDLEIFVEKGSKYVTLPDGRAIVVEFDEKSGKITRINVYYETSKERADYNPTCPSDTENVIHYNPAFGGGIMSERGGCSTDVEQNSITNDEPFDFSQLKPFLKAIFGDTIPESAYP